MIGYKIKNAAKQYTTIELKDKNLNVKFKDTDEDKPCQKTLQFTPFCCNSF